MDKHNTENVHISARSTREGEEDFKERPFPNNLRKRTRTTEHDGLSVRGVGNDEDSWRAQSKGKRARVAERRNEKEQRLTETLTRKRVRKEQSGESNRKKAKVEEISEEESFRRVLNRLSKVLTILCSCKSCLQAEETFEKIRHFLLNLAHTSLGDETVFVTAFVLLDRIIIAKKPIVITAERVHEVFCGLILLASKFLRDLPTWNLEASRLLPLHRIHEVELELLECLNWDVWVSKAQFDYYKTEIMR